MSFLSGQISDDGSYYTWEVGDKVHFLDLHSEAHHILPMKDNSYRQPPRMRWNDYLYLLHYSDEQEAVLERFHLNSGDLEVFSTMPAGLIPYPTVHVAGDFLYCFDYLAGLPSSKLFRMDLTGEPI